MWRYESGNWTWISGGNISDSVGVYGTKGVAAPNNIPGARKDACGWVDAVGFVWIFGGTGRATSASPGTIPCHLFSLLGRLNDLWRLNTTNGLWAWISGSNTTNHGGGYSGSLLLPKSRENAMFWTDSSFNFWLFGGTDSLEGKEYV